MSTTSVHSAIVYRLLDQEHSEKDAEQLLEKPEKTALENLSELNLSKMGLTTFPDAFSHYFWFKRITGIDLSGNNLTDIPPGLDLLDELKVLDLTNNPLQAEESAMKAALDKITKLRVVTGLSFDYTPVALRKAPPSSSTCIIL